MSATHFFPRIITGEQPSMHQRLSDKKSEWEGTDCRQTHVPGAQAGRWDAGKAPGDCSGWKATTYSAPARPAQG